MDRCSTIADVTRILTAIEQGDARATGELSPLVYQELRRLAAHKMAHEPPAHTLQPTALGGKADNGAAAAPTTWIWKRSSWQAPRPTTSCLHLVNRLTALRTSNRGRPNW